MCSPSSASTGCRKVATGQERAKIVMAVPITELLSSLMNGTAMFVVQGLFMTIVDVYICDHRDERDCT